jgi:hypothetical protein
MQNSDVSGLSIQDLRVPQNMKYRKFGITNLISGKPAYRKLDSAFMRYVPDSPVSPDSVATPQINLPTNRRYAIFPMSRGGRLTAQLNLRQLPGKDVYNIPENDQRQPTSAGIVNGTDPQDRVENSYRFHEYPGNAQSKGVRSTVKHADNATRSSGSVSVFDQIRRSQSNPIVAEAASKTKSYKESFGGSR